MGQWVSCLTGGTLCLALPCEGEAAGALLQMSPRVGLCVCTRAVGADGVARNALLQQWFSFFWRGGVRCSLCVAVIACETCDGHRSNLLTGLALYTTAPDACPAR